MRPTDKKECIHHWRIEPATGPTSRGRCTKCHRVRVFDNYLTPDICRGSRGQALGVLSHT
jgi:hypothetical protein